MLHAEVTDPELNFAHKTRLRPGGTLNVEVIGMLVGNFLGSPKRYPDFDFKALTNTQIAILRAVSRTALGKMASIFQTFSRRP